MVHIASRVHGTAKMLKGGINKGTSRLKFVYGTPAPYNRILAMGVDLRLAQPQAPPSLTPGNYEPDVTTLYIGDLFIKSPWPQAIRDNAYLSLS